MKFFWYILSTVVAILMKENSCVPAIRPLSQRSIIFPEDNWDDCFLDEASTWPGICKRLEECPEVLKKWDKENIYPKTCYFIKMQQYVCCPIATSKEAFTSTTENLENIFITNTENPTKKPSNIFLDKINTDAGAVTKKPENKDATSTTTKRPSNIFLDKFQNSQTSTTKRPSNIFLDNLNADKTTSRKPPSAIPDIFNTDKPSFVKRRSEIECELQNQDKFDINGASSEPNEFPFMAVLGWKSNIKNKIWYACGGVLISSRFVLTAAHCAELGGENPYVVHFGDENLTDSQEGTIKIKQFIIHPGSNITTIYNDIALVELEEEVNKPLACLWIQHDLPITKLTALGYGHASFETLSSNQLFKTSLSAINKTQCQDYYKLDDKLRTTDIVDAHLCAGDVKNAHSSCQGDTGGPLIMKLEKISYVVGITSFGLGCADLPPSIYTRVSSFIEWIEPIVWPEIDVRFDRK